MLWESLYHMQPLWTITTFHSGYTPPEEIGLIKLMVSLHGIPMWCRARLSRFPLLDSGAQDASVIVHWFDLLQRLLIEYRVKDLPGQLFNCDESGLNPLTFLALVSPDFFYILKA